MCIEEGHGVQEMLSKKFVQEKKVSEKGTARNGLVINFLLYNIFFIQRLHFFYSH